MGLQGSRFRGKVRIHGRPREQAKAEIMLMKHREAYENRKRRRIFFTLLDVIAAIAFLGGIYQIYVGKLTNGFILIGVGILILAYFVLRRTLRNKKDKI